MAFQGKEFSPEMKQLIVNLKQYFDEEKKAGKTASTKNATGRVAHGLGIGEATVKRIMATHKQEKVVVVEEKERGKPPYRLSLNLQPVIREFIRKKNLKGQKIGAEQIREYLLEKHSVEIPMSTFLRSLNRLGFTYGVGKRRTALKEQDYVVLARRRYLRRKIGNRKNDGSLKRPEVYLDETYINKNHSDQFTWYLEEDGPWVNKPSGKGPRVIVVHAITVNGWVDNAQLVFDANRRTGDYHGQMNWGNFSKWLETQLLPMKSRSRKRPLVDARSVLARIAVRTHGYKGTEVAKALSLSPPSVSRLVENGENILDNQKCVAVKIAVMEL